MSVEVAEEHAKPDLIGEVLANRYQIECRLGEGAMGSVYKAKHVKVGRPFAVKVLHKKLIEDKKVLQRFEREAELAGRLRHPNVVGVVDVGETADGFRYMVMDFAEGNDLATMLNEAPMPPERIINLTRQMLEGLYHAHEQGLIHRDFKPENVIIEQDDHGVEVPRIVDFGIAILREGGDSANSAGRLTTNGLVLGTPHYMAPEQAVADPIDHRIDLFALGIVIYEMLCGKLPFDGTGAEVARANLLLDPPPISQRVPFLEVDPLLEAFARRLMSKKRELRPATAKAARELLDLIIHDPASAAAALGVPLGASARTPAITQPTSPVGDAHGDADAIDAAIDAARAVDLPEASSRLARAHSRPGTPAPVAGLEAPAYPTPAPIDEPARSQHHIRTDAAAPLAFGDDDIAPPKKSTKLIAIGIGAVAIAAIIAFVAVRSGKGDDDSSKQPDEPTKVVMQADPPKQPDPPPVKPADPPVAVDPPVGDPPVGDPPVVDPPVVTDPPKKQPVIVKKQPEVKKPDPVEIKQDPPVDPNAKPAVISAADLYKLYGAVGGEILAVAKSNPEAAAKFQDDYRQIQIQTATATEASRQQGEQALRNLRAKIAAAKKKP